MTHYQYKGNSVLKLSSTVCHDVGNYFQYLWKPIVILAACSIILYHSLSWCFIFTTTILKPEPKFEYPIATIKERLESPETNKQSKKAKK